MSLVGRRGRLPRPTLLGRTSHIDIDDTKERLEELPTRESTKSTDTKAQIAGWLVKTTDTVWDMRISFKLSKGVLLPGNVREYNNQALMMLGDKLIQCLMMVLIGKVDLSSRQYEVVRRDVESSWG
uniref:Uncharacterized protein n=1 Tax=Nelumbo nucifera TaxID=4432 RepID=A0A822YAK7_NELNU|nr:TPA_asm: hypothetical protein HUJ06_030915 [Nelumbo nucifera]